MLLLLFLLFCAHLAQSTKPSVQWTIENAANNPPSQRGAGRMDYFVDNPHKGHSQFRDSLYIFGGFDECFDANAPGCDHVWNNELWRYNFQSDEWTNMNPTPDPVHGVPAPRGFLGSDVYTPESGPVSINYYAGAQYNPLVTVRQWYGDIWEYTPSTNSWRNRVPTNSPIPGARLGPAIAIWENTMYMFGGISASFQFLNDLWSYDLITDQWTLIIPSNASNPNLPPANFAPQFQLAYKGHRLQALYMYGGNIFPPGSGAQNEDIWKYSFSTNSWLKIATVPSVPGANVGRVHGASTYKNSNNKFIITMGDKDDAISECRINLPSAGQLPTNGTWYMKENGPNPTWNEVQTTFIPKLKRVYYANKDDDALYIWGGFGFSCVNQTDVAEWNRNLYKLDISRI